MKKLIVLAAVLGLASMACALPTLALESYNATTDEAVISVTVGTEPDGFDVLIWTDAYGVYSGRLVSVGGVDPLVSDSTFTFAKAHEDYPTDIVKYAYNDGTDGDQTYGGVLFTFVVDTTGLTVGDILTLTTLDGGFNELGTTDIVIPEPMTMGLLGLGGLFLRRRK